MTRQKKSLQQKSTELVFDRLKEIALAFVQEGLSKNCAVVCNCSNILPDLFVEAIKSIPPQAVAADCPGKDGLNKDGLCINDSSIRDLGIDDLSIDELCDCLSRVYEHLLLYTVKPGTEKVCSLVLIEKSKKRLGNFYTPRNLAVLAVEKALHQLVFDEVGHLKTADEILKLKIVDPSMGCGMFLSAALAFVGERLYATCSATTDLRSCREAVLLNCLYGVDLDLAAVRVARYLLMLQCGCAGQLELESKLEQKLKCGNSLVGLLPSTNLHPASPSLSGAHMVGSLQEADVTCNKLLGLASDAATPFQYFHWALQFPEVFAAENPGFDAVLGNPPWEILKPNSREFFQQKDEQYWQRGKQDALRKQDELRAEQHVDDEWKQYQNSYKLFSLWLSKSNFFQLQGTSDINAYKLFVELSLMISRATGVVSLIVPSSLYSDKGSSTLRRVLLLQNEWLNLSTFQNSEGMFDIHRSFKFCVFLIRRGGTTSALTANFDARDVRASQNTLPFKLELRHLKNFSPNWLSVPEVESDRDLRIVEKISAKCVRFEDFAKRFHLKFRREFDMTNDSHKFIQRDYAEQIGYRADSHGKWLLGKWKELQVRQHERGECLDFVVSADGGFFMSAKDIEDVALPLYEGRMVGQFDVAQKGWVQGKGRQALWLPVPDKRILPQYLISQRDYDAVNGASEGAGGLKVGFLGVGSATNMRSMIAACLGSYPCGNSVPTINCPDPRIVLVLTACLNSFVFDYLLRMRLVGNNLNYFILQETFLPEPDRLLADSAITEIAARLSWNDKHHAPALRCFLPESVASKLALADSPLSDAVQTSVDNSLERMHLQCVLDALIADLYGLDVQDLEHVLRGCDRQSKGRRVNSMTNDEDKLSPRGFWRIDKNKKPGERQTVLTLNAFKALKESGRAQFGYQKNSAGWEVPSAGALNI